MMNKQDETPSGRQERKRTEVLSVDDLRDTRRPTCSVVEAARLLGISKGSAYELARTGRLPVIEITPHRWRVSCAGLLTMLGVDG